MLKLHYYITGMLESFAGIYPFLEQGQYTKTLSEMLQVMSPTSRKNRGNDHQMLDLTAISLEAELLRQNLSPDLIRELVTVATRTNYGQAPGQMHAFVGSVALAGAEGHLWSIEGGNHLLPEKLFESSKAFLVHSEV